MNERERLIEKLYEWGNKENDGVRAESIAMEGGILSEETKGVLGTEL